MTLLNLARRELGNAEDNLYRAQCAAMHCNQDLKWGESGRTLREIIEDYQQWVIEAKKNVIKASRL